MQNVSWLPLWLALAVPVLSCAYSLGRYAGARAFGLPVTAIRVGFGGAIYERGALAVHRLPLYVRVELDRSADRTFGRAMTMVTSIVALYLAPAPLIFVVGLTLWPHDSELAGPPIVSDALPGSPAWNADIVAGDRIVSVEGEPIASLQDLETITSARAGQSTRISIERDRQRLEREATPDGTGHLGLFTQRRKAYGLSAGEALEKAMIAPAEVTALHLERFMPETLPSEGMPFVGSARLVAIVEDEAQELRSARAMYYIYHLAPISTVAALLQLIPIRPFALGGLLGIPRRRRRAGKEKS